MQLGAVWTPMTDQLRKQLLENKELYKKIKSVEAIPKQWFNAVIETDDLRYIVQNVEARIAREIDAQINEKKLNIQLWYMYIKYLLTKDRLLAEEVYYRFRRIFLYQRTLENAFPQFDGKLSEDAKSAMENMKFNHPYKFTPLPSSPLTIYSNEKWVKQVLPFRESLMHYIFQKASFKITKKLYASCKHLYFLQRKPIFHSLYVGNELKLQYFRNSMATDGETSEFLEMDKIILTNTLIVQHSENSNLLHSISPKFASCNLRFLRVTNQSFFVNEYKFLTEAGRIMKLVFQKVTIKDENGEPIILENFLYNLPQAMYIDAPIKTRTTSETEKLLFTWNKPTKIHCISLLLDDELMEILRPMRLFKFLSRLVVNVKKSTNVVQFEKGNENISNYLQDLIASTQIWKHEHNDQSPPKVLTLKDYENLL
uniref:Uncharacterized protein n=1 Tax=Panagrolaimus superbus TaxID=310955 RepID=A0A914YZH8_9BILA